MLIKIELEKLEGSEIWVKIRGKEIEEIETGPPAGCNLSRARGQI